jgi:hypothetical protein
MSGVVCATRENDLDELSNMTSIILKPGETLQALPALRFIHSRPEKATCDAQDPSLPGYVIEPYDHVGAVEQLLGPLHEKAFCDPRWTICNLSNICHPLRKGSFRKITAGKGDLVEFMCLNPNVISNLSRQRRFSAPWSAYDVNSLEVLTTL